MSSTCLLKTSGPRIFCRSFGGQGLSMVLVHGITGSHTYFAGTALGLKRICDVSAVDLRGHGWSDRASTYCIQDYARDISEVLALKEFPAALYGHSLGALVALAVPRFAGSRVAALILEDPPLFHITGPLRQSSPAIAHAFENIRKLLRESNGLQGIFSELLGQKKDRDLDSTAARAIQMAGVDPEVLTAAIDNTIACGVDPESTVRAIACPVLLLRGAEQRGSTTRGDDLEWLRKLVPDLRVREFPEAGHHISGSIDVVPVVREFLHDIGLSG